MRCAGVCARSRKSGVVQRPAAPRNLRRRFRLLNDRPGAALTLLLDKIDEVAERAQRGPLLLGNRHANGALDLDEEANEVERVGPEVGQRPVAAKVGAVDAGQLRDKREDLFLDAGRLAHGLSRVKDTASRKR